MTDKPHKKDTNSAPDVPADNPEGTMERFTAGLRKVLNASRRSTKRQRTKKHQRSA